MTLKNTIHKYISSINKKYLIIALLILITIIIAVVIIDFSDNNISAQPDLYKLHNKINNLKRR